MRGQATPIQHLHQRDISPNNKNASDKLPSYLQSLHQFQPTKPSHGFSETGLGRLKPNGFKTPGSFQTYLLFTMYPKQALPSIVDEGANLYFSRRQFAAVGSILQYSAIARRRSFGALAEGRSEGPLTRERQNFGGAERDRTADPLLAKQVLSQLSYSPIQLDHPSLSTRRGNNSHRPTVSTQTLIRICKWWAREDLNFRPHAYQACALTN